MANVENGQLILGGQLRAYNRGQLGRNIQIGVPNTTKIVTKLDAIKTLEKLLISWERSEMAGVYS